MAEIVLKRNVFEFGADHYVQVSGTAIGTKMAPSYANIFMAQLEARILGGAALKPMEFWRYIDDCFMIWQHGEVELLRFFEMLNSFHPSIQFTYEYSETRVNFLDVTVNLESDGRIWTDLYTKPTDTHQYLLASSCHPNHVKRSIGYSQTIRIRNICNDDVVARKRASELTENLIRRGHSRRKVRKEVDRAFNIPLQEIVAGERRARINTRIPLVTTYHPGLPDISGILRQYQGILQQSERLQQVTMEPTLLAFRRPPNLSNSLVGAWLLCCCQRTSV